MPEEPMMTVKDLLALLAHHDPNAVVLVRNRAGSFFEAGRVISESRVRLPPDGNEDYPYALHTLLDVATRGSPPLPTVYIDF